jgi:hypothetical protein
MSRAPRPRGVRERSWAQPACATPDQLADAYSEQIPDLQTCDGGDRDEHYGSWRLGTRNAQTNTNAERNQDGWNQDKYGEALSEGRPNQKDENGEHHLGWTF